MSRRNAKYPCQRHERNEQRAVGNTGSYAVRHCRAEHGGRQRLLSPSTGACHSTPPARNMEAAAGRDVQAIRCGTFLYRSWNRTREIQKPLVFGGVLFHISFAVERNMAAGGIHAGRGCNPQSENGKWAVGDAGPYGGIDESAPVFEGAPMRAVGDAGPYEGAAIEVRRYPKMYRCGYDNGARHHQRGTRERQRCQFKDSWRDLRAPPRGTRERQRGETYKRFDAEPFCTAVVIGQGKSKNRWFLAAFFSIFLSLLKEIWPPEA